MKQLEKVMLARKIVTEMDAFVMCSSHDGGALFWRYVEGPDGEDPEVSENLSSIVPVDIFIMQLEHRLDEMGIPVTDYTKDVIQHAVDARLGYPAEVWRFRIYFPPVIVMGDDKTLQRCKKLAAGNEWKKGIQVKKKSKTKSYKIGQEVRPAHNSRNSKYRWWFVTSYRTPSNMGMFRLLRNDGVLTSTASLTVVEAD